MRGRPHQVSAGAQLHGVLSADGARRDPWVQFRAARRRTLLRGWRSRQAPRPESRPGRSRQSLWRAVAAGAEPRIVRVVSAQRPQARQPARAARGGPQRRRGAFGSAGGDDGRRHRHRRPHCDPGPVRTGVARLCTLRRGPRQRSAGKAVRQARPRIQRCCDTSSDAGPVRQPRPSRRPTAHATPAAVAARPPPPLAGCRAGRAVARRARIMPARPGVGDRTADVGTARHAGAARPPGADGIAPWARATLRLVARPGRSGLGARTRPSGPRPAAGRRCGSLAPAGDAAR